MFKETITPLVLSILTISSAFAGGPDFVASHNLTYVGINSGFSLNIAQYSATYDNTANNRSQEFDNTGYDSSLLLGLKIGHQWQISQSNDIFVEAGGFYNWAKIKDTSHLDDVVAPGTQPFDLINTIQPKLQLNLNLGIAHYINDSLSIHLNAGPSVLYVKSDYNTKGGNALAIIDEGPSQSETDWLWGGNIGFGIDMWLTQHSVLNCNINDYVYASHDLKRVNNVDNTTPTGDNINSRKLFITMPAITFGYNYYF